MSSSMVNDSGGMNHIKFSRLSHRLSKVNVDVVHRVRSKGGLDTHLSAVPETGDRGCHFQDELERCKTLDTASSFKRFYYAMLPLCQSLPELLHHAEQVVALLEDHLSKVAALELGSFMQLCSVLARDLQEDLWPYFHRLFGALVHRVNSVVNAIPGSPSPELTGQLFECLSYLIKYALNKLAESHDSMRQYYGVLLGHPTPFVRDMAARSFVILLRKLKPAAYSSHVKKLLKALAGQCRSCTDVGQLHVSDLEPGRGGVVHSDGESDPKTHSFNAAPARMSQLIEGVSLLLFYTARGIRGCLHSKGAAKLVIPMDLWVPVDSSDSEQVVQARASTLSLLPSSVKAAFSKHQEAECSAKLEALSFACGSVMSLVTVRLFRHAHPSNMTELWLRLVDGVGVATTHLEALTTLCDAPTTVSSCIECAALYSVELLLWAISHSSNRALSNKTVRKAVGSSVTSATLKLVEASFLYASSVHGQRRRSSWCNGQGIQRLSSRSRLLLCRLWLAFPRDAGVLSRIDALLVKGLRAGRAEEPPALVFCNELIGTLPSDLLRKHVVAPVLSAVLDLSRAEALNGSGSALWLVIVTEVLSHLSDVRIAPPDVLGAIGEDVLAISAQTEHQKQSLKQQDRSQIDQEWADMDYANEDEVDEDDMRAGGRNEESGQPSQELSRLVKSCEGELLQLAYAAAECLTLAISSIPSSNSSATCDNTAGVLACSVLRWMAVACPKAQHNKLLQSTQYSALLRTANSLLKNKDLLPATLHLGPTLMAHLVVFMCDEKGSDGTPTAVSVTKNTKTGSSKATSLANANATVAVAPGFPASLPDLFRSYIALFIASPPSLALSWGLLELLRCLEQVGSIGLCQVLDTTEQSALLEFIASNICTPSYWLRMFLLRLVAKFPSPQLTPTRDDSEFKNVDLAGLLLQAANISPDLRTEREFKRIMGSLEVLLRGQRLPAMYIRLACNFCLSILNTKFQPFWEPAVSAMVAAAGATEGEDVLWPLLLKAIVSVGQQRDAEGQKDGDVDRDDGDVEGKQSAITSKSQSATQPIAAKRRFRPAGDDEDAEVEAAENEVDEEGGLQEESNRPIKPHLHDCIQALLRSDLDSGKVPVPPSVACSAAFFYSLPNISHLIVAPDSRADSHTVYQSAWSVLKKVPAITMRRSKVVIPMFLAFVTKDYYGVFGDDPEIPWLRHVGLFDPALIPQEQTESSTPLPLRQLKSRLRMFLQVFSQVPSPKSLFCHELLFTFYVALTSSSEATLAQLALDCLISYKPPFLMPFKDNLKRLLDDKTMRDEMVTFDISIRNTSIDPRHRPDLIPLVVRLVYGRFAARARSSRASREQSLARRAAALSFFSSLEGSEIVHVVQLLFRTVLPRQSLLAAPPMSRPSQPQAISHVTITEQADAWYSFVQTIVESIESSDMAQVSWERQISFLHVLEQVIKSLGFAVSPHVVSLCSLVMHMLSQSQNFRDGGDVELDTADVLEDAEATDGHGQDNSTALVAASTDAAQGMAGSRMVVRADAANSLRVRTLSLLRLAELVHQYHAQLDPTLLSANLMRPLEPLLASMPHSIGGATRVPALIKLLHALVQHPEMASIVEQNSDIVETVIRCVGSKCEQGVTQAIMDVITRLLEMNDGSSVLPHASLIIYSFSRRFAGASWDASGAATRELRLNELVIVPSGSVRQELSLLCRIAEGLFTRSDVIIEAHSVLSLATLLLGMLRTYTTSRKVRVEESWVADILRIYKSLLPRLPEVDPHVGFLSRLFGPAGHSQSLFNHSSVRNMLASTFVAVAAHPSTRGLLRPAAAALVQLVLPDAVTLLGRDFGACMPVFQVLAAGGGADGSVVNNGASLKVSVTVPSSQQGQDQQVVELSGWESLLHYPGSSRDAHAGSAVIFEMLRCLSDEEMVVRSAAVASLQRLIEVLAEWEEARVFGSTGNDTGGAAGAEGKQMDASGGKSPAWTDILLSIIMPALRRGLKESSDMVKKGYVTLLAHAVVVLGRTPSAQAQSEAFFHSDLQCLMHVDPEQDFFENITHIQSHRRARAMMRLRIVLQRTAPGLATVTVACGQASATIKSSKSVKRKIAGQETEVEDENDILSKREDDEDVMRDISDGESDGAEPMTIDDVAVQDEAAAAASSGRFVFSTTSLVHVLLPLACHPLFSDEFIKKDHSPLLHEAASFLGAIALHLPWSQFMTLIKTILKQLERGRAEKEKILLTALCSVLDSFHFDLSGNTEATGINIAAIAQDSTRVINSAAGGNKDQDGTGTEAVPASGAEIDVGPDDDDAALITTAHVTSYVPPPATGSNISRAIVNQVMPWVQAFLLKSEKDHKGQDSQVVRTGVAVALTKLIARLQAPVVPEAKRLVLFQSLVMRVVTTLKSRDTAARDQARESLARMVQTMGLRFLRPVLHELQHTLTLGYQRHVCNYTVRSLLVRVLDGSGVVGEINKKYMPPIDAPSLPVLTDDSGTNESNPDNAQMVKPNFDDCIPMIMMSVMDDINGLTQGDRDVDGAVTRKSIREAKGSKANEIVELCARVLLFRPTYALRRLDDPRSVSSVHALCGPLLESLTDTEDAALVGRVNEALARAALGLARNPSVLASELLLYLHATLQPFVAAMIRDYEQHKRSLGMLNSAIAEARSNAREPGGGQGQEDNDQEDQDDAAWDDELPSYLREESSDEEDAALYSRPKNDGLSGKSARGDNVKGFRANTWLPSDRRSQDQRSVLEARDREKRERDQVLDGTQAPKLTGSARQAANKSKASAGSGGGGTSDPAALVAVKFCLTLFMSSLKRSQLDSSDSNTRSMVMPFLPLLGQCLRLPGAGQVVALAMRCLCGLLSWGLPVDTGFGRAVGARMLKLMVRGGALLSSDGDLVQACLRGLTSLFALHKNRVAAAAAGADAAGAGAPGIVGASAAVSSTKQLKKKQKRNLPDNSSASNEHSEVQISGGGQQPLSDIRLRALLQMLTLSITEITASYQSAAFALIKAIIESRVLLPELYDLVTKLGELIVLSQRQGIRDACSATLVDFLTHYPVGQKRLQGHLKQLVASCAFEHADGRRSALDTLAQLCRYLPPAALDDHGQTIFLPMTLRLVNDPDSACRVAAAAVVTALCRRVSGEMFSLLLEYCVKWGGSSERALVRTGAQALGLLIAARPDGVKKSGVLPEMVQRLCDLMHVLVSEEARGGRGGSLERREMALFAEGLGEGDAGSGGTESWAVLYHVMCLLESTYTHLPSAADSAFAKFGGEISNGAGAARVESSASKLGPAAIDLVQEATLYPHAWVRAASARVLKLYLLRRDPAGLGQNQMALEPLARPNALYQLSRRMCVVLNQPMLPPGLQEVISFALVWALRAMHLHPELRQGQEQEQDEEEEEQEQEQEQVFGTAYEEIEDADNRDEDDDDDDDDDDDEDEDEDESDDEVFHDDEREGGAGGVVSISATPATTNKPGASAPWWVFQRLRGLGLDSRGERRFFVLGVFRVLIATCPPSEDSLLIGHLPLMLEVAMRCHQTATGPDADQLKRLREQAGELLALLEQRVGAIKYVGVYAEVQRRVQANKAAKKREQAKHAVTDPAAFANAKIAKRKRDVAAKKKKQAKRSGSKKKRGGDGAILFEE